MSAHEDYTRTEPVRGSTDRAFGLIVGGFFAFLVALAQYLSKDRIYFWQIMLPGCVLGIIVGYATQRYGTGSAASTS